MSNFGLGADGPFFVLNKKDIKSIRKNNHIELTNENLIARISITKHDPNQLNFPNGAISAHDLACNDGVRIRRYPENICPHDFKGNQYYILRIQKSLFNKLVEKSKTSFDRMEYIHPRCKYDRFELIIYGVF